MLTTAQVALIADVPPLKLAAIVRKLDMEHLCVGSGRTLDWSVVDALTVAFARALVDEDGRQTRRPYERYRDVARWAAKMADADNPPGWIVITERQQHVYPADWAEKCADWLYAHDGAARVLCCAPILERLRTQQNAAAAPSAQ